MSNGFVAHVYVCKEREGDVMQQAEDFELVVEIDDPDEEHPATGNWIIAIDNGSGDAVSIDLHKLYVALQKAGLLNIEYS